MKALKLTVEQKALILKQGEEDTSVAEICPKSGTGQSTYFVWSKKGSENSLGDSFSTHEV